MGEEKYSQYGLINRGLLELNEKGLMNRMLKFLISDKRLTFTINVPGDLFFRAEILCDDIVQRREQDKAFSQNELAEHIFYDFIDEVRNYDGNVRIIYNRLEVRKQEMLYLYEHLPAKSRTKLQVKIDKPDVLRAEIFLQDIAQFEPEHGLDVEKLIEIVYLEFLLDYKKGRRTNVIQDIIDYIDGE